MPWHGISELPLVAVLGIESRRIVAQRIHRRQRPGAEYRGGGAFDVNRSAALYSMFCKRLT